MYFITAFFYFLLLSAPKPSYSIDIIKALAAHHEFNIISAMLQASGVAHYLEVKQNIGDGKFTLFVPVDKAFVDLPPSIVLQSLASDKKTLLVKGHILTVFYPLNLLLTSHIPEQETLASHVINSAFLHNISSVNATVFLRIGIVEAVITKTLLDERPISIFGISKVLLPKEIYEKNPMVFHSPPPPPPSSPPAIDGKEEDVADTEMWLLAVLICVDCFLAILVFYSMRLVARIYKY